MASRRDVISARDSASARIGRYRAGTYGPCELPALSRAIDPITGYSHTTNNRRSARVMQGEGARVTGGSDLAAAQQGCSSKISQRKKTHNSALHARAQTARFQAPLRVRKLENAAATPETHSRSLRVRFSTAPDRLWSRWARRAWVTSIRSDHLENAGSRTDQRVLSGRRTHGSTSH